MNIVNAKLLIEEKPIKIHLDGFTTAETLDLRDIIEERGGEISPYPGRGVVTLSPVNYRSRIESHRYDVNWLHDSISANVVQNITKYRLDFSNTNSEHNVEEIDHHPLESINEGFQEENTEATNFHSIRECTIQITEVISLSSTHVSTDFNENTVPRDKSRVRRKSARIQQLSQQPDYTNCDSPGKNELLKKKRQCYTEDENRQMIEYLVKKKAILVAGGVGIWRQMQKEGMMQHHSERALALYFCQTLIKKAEKYTNDEKAKELFRLRRNSIQRRKRRRSY